MKELAQRIKKSPVSFAELLVGKFVAHEMKTEFKYLLMGFPRWKRPRLRKLVRREFFMISLDLLLTEIASADWLDEQTKASISAASWVVACNYLAGLKMKKRDKTYDLMYDRTSEYHKLQYELSVATTDETSAQYRKIQQEFYRAFCRNIGQDELQHLFAVFGLQVETSARLVSLHHLFEETAAEAST